MKKLIFLLVIIAIFASLFYFYPNSKKRELITTLTPLSCDLNVSECEVDYKGKKIIFDLSPKPLKTLEETKVIIKNLEDFPKLNARLYGLNMYMGDIVGEFEKIDNAYIADIVFSACTENTMRYRLELFNDNKSLDLSIDFDVRR
ncbi:hypothetical protein [Campylobacter sp. 2018MI13]|uniref:hypothetical protein n=1 Tax=Campylobacter sp. 2018MI13 TaxID=2836737 RepID=UPI001BDABB2B|nr:hypothetical protein [Campylobacter sp. 2018MI13]MBT0882072.1 hypothetical protein [Campylobacter sp. 2018MI13]